MQTDYAKLQAKGIEIIAINVDDSRAKWEKTSGADSIRWTNLYAGENAGQELKYGVKGYPTKLAFDRNLDFVNVKLKTTNEILSWAEGVE